MRGRLVLSVLLAVGSAVAVPAPASAETLSGYFTDVACPTATRCFAVGRTFATNSTKTLAEHWDGKKWSIVAVPNVAKTSQLGGTFLSGVACSSATSCFAVGYSATKKGNRLARTPYAAHWNGTKWAIVPSANPSGNTYSELESVSCLAGNTCIAVGHAQPAVSGAKPLFERWNGKAFTTMPSGPLPAGATDTALLAVTCRTAANCVAVGRTDGSVIIEQWNGTTWSVAATPKFPGQGLPELKSVSCPTAKHCVAVGIYSDNQANTKALVVAGYGSKWSQLKGAGASSLQSWLSGVACPTTTTCLAVGSIARDFSSSLTFAERSSGNTWSRTPTPSPDTRGNAANTLTAVACPSVKHCFAVGEATTGKNPAPIMHWNGTKWSLAPHPNP